MFQMISFKYNINKVAKEFGGLLSGLLGKVCLPRVVHFKIFQEIYFKKRFGLG